MVGRTVIGMVHKGSAVVGAGATVAVGLGVFFAVSASNAEEFDPAPVTPAGHYSTIEAQDFVEYVPEPEPIPAPEPVVVEEPVVSEPVPEPVVEQPAPEPAPLPEPVPSGDKYAPPPPTDFGPPPEMPAPEEPIFGREG